MISQARAQFARHLGGSPSVVVRSPGRVNLIGEHTDYNDGFVLPLAIDRAIWVAARPRDDGVVRVWSDHAAVWAEFSLTRLMRAPGWDAYLQGVAHEMIGAGHPLVGWEGVMVADLPVGAGLSSSAALELAVAMTFAAVGGLPWDPVAMAQLAQRADNHWVGIGSGIMDHLTCAAAVEGTALMIDCRHLTTEPVPLPDGVAVAILDTGTRRRLTESVYNERRQACERVAGALGIAALRDATLEDLAAAAGRIDAVDLRRAQYVVAENRRVPEMAERLIAGDLEACGDLMAAGHAGLRDGYEVSSPALDAMVQAALDAPGCRGARLTGAGLGGCCVALVDAASLEPFAAATLDAYEKATGLKGEVTFTKPVRGTSVEYLVPSP